MGSLVPIMDHALPLLTREEEQLLVRKAKAGCEQSKEKFFRHNLRLVNRLVERSDIYISGYDLEDLVSIGCAAMVKAFNYFQPERGLKFSTIAGLMIKQAIGAEKRRYGMGHGVRLAKADTIEGWQKSVSKIHSALSEGVLALDAPPKNTKLDARSVSDPQAEEALDDTLVLAAVDRALDEDERALVAFLLEDKTHKEFDEENDQGDRDHNQRHATLSVIKQKLAYVRQDYVSA